MASELLARFTRQDLVYKTVNSIPLSIAILTPNPLPSNTTNPKAYPAIVHFHGGALITGTNPDPAFTSQWLLTLALTTPAILISPQYRLLPEATGTDLMDDIRDFWTWFRSSPALTTIAPKLSLSKVLAAGESAGGFLAIQSALLFNPRSAGIQAVAATYPAQYPDVKTYNLRHAGVAPNSADDAVVDAYLAAVRRGERPVRVSTPWGTSAEVEGLIGAMGPTGRHREMMGGDGRLTLGGALEGTGRAAIWIVQGREDDLVVKEGADELVQRLRGALPEMPVMYTVETGGHVFDLSVGMNEPWVKEGLEFVKKYWLAND